MLGRASESIVASTTTVLFKTDVITLTGTTNIATIQAPPAQGGFCTVIFVVPVDGTVNTVTTGNIMKAVAMVQNQVCVFTYSKRLAKWFPGAIS